MLAELSPNRVLGFVCGFLQNLLRNLSICKRIYDKPNPQLRESGLNYQVRVLSAFRDGGAELARFGRVPETKADRLIAQTDELLGCVRY